MDKNNKESNPFADYVWMGDMDKFDREIEAQIEEEFEEEEFIKSCIEQLLDEEEEQTVFFHNNKFDKKSKRNDAQNHQQGPMANMNGIEPNLTQSMNNMYIGQPHHPHAMTPLPMPIHQQPPYQNGDLIYENNGQMPSQQQWYTGNTEPIPYHPAPSRIMQKSTLNPNASPFIMNPNAKVFVPQFGNKSSPDKEQS